MRPIGGYFQWETPKSEESPHPNARLALKSARACVKVLAQACRLTRIWIPYYTCDSLTEPFAALGIDVHYYAINTQMEFGDSWPELGETERMVYINYFGLKTSFATKLEQHYGEQLWIDNTQAFFHQPIDPKSFYFNSARKFFGVPDGAYLYGPTEADIPSANSWPPNADYVYEHLFLRHSGKVTEGYPYFRKNERRAGGEVARISELSESALSQIDCDSAARRRRENYCYLHGRLAESNRMAEEVITLSDKAVPFCYPYLPSRPITHHYFWNRCIFIPTFWPECLVRQSQCFLWEKQLSTELLPLPIDHRYGPNEMEQILRSIASHQY